MAADDPPCGWRHPRTSVLSKAGAASGGGAGESAENPARLLTSHGGGAILSEEEGSVRAASFRLPPVKPAAVLRRIGLLSGAGLCAGEMPLSVEK